MPTPKLIEFCDVTILRGEKRALDRVTFSIGAGEHVAILGPNGSGKSTLIQAITRECYPSLSEPPGRVRIWGKDVWHLFELRGLLGIVTNDLVSACTKPFPALETVLSGFFGSIGIWPYHEVTPEMEERAMAALEFFEIAHLAGRPLTSMSSGEVRRTVLARALVHDPKALVLDEPTNSLDVRAQREVRDAMRKLAAGGVSVVLVSHHLPDIIPEIRRVIGLREGRVFSDGPVETELEPEKLSRLFGVPVRVAAIDGCYHLW
jgi:iron complex transport system ATP-binding protein